jgi:C4-dicarboxylate-specific signal transduction histidine kinase
MTEGELCVSPQAPHLGARSGWPPQRVMALACAVLVAAGVLGLDLIAGRFAALGVLYVVTIVLVAQYEQKAAVLVTGLSCAFLASGVFLAHGSGNSLNEVLSLAAIGAATWLGVRDREAEHGRMISEHRYRSLFNAAGFAVWESDWSEVHRRLRAAVPESEDPARFLSEHPEVVQQAAEGSVILDCNAAAVALFDADGREALIGRQITSLYTDQSRDMAVSFCAVLLKGGQERETETQFLTFSGRLIDVLHRVSIVPDGEPWSRIVFMAIDVTERNQARTRMDELSAELAHAARVSLLGQLTASIAHEVNQPLTAITNQARSGERWLARTPPQVEEALESLRRIATNAGRAADVIARTRGLARKTAAKVEPLDLAEAVAAAVGLLDREAKRAGARMAWRKASDASHGLGDRIQVQQVLLNLLMNGLQAMANVADRPRELLVSIADREGGEVMVSVRDSGPGVEDPDRIFTPFFTTKSEGMGMGLSICRTIIEAQGGRIWAENNPDAGATISFTLPATQAAGASAAPAPAQALA